MIEQVLTRANLVKAYKQVVRNKGCAGVDKMQVSDLKTNLQENWQRIKAELETGSYIPNLVLGKEIPKANGGVRMLGIPTVIDRMIQQAIQQVLSPLYEAEFSPFSYAFRPQRSAHQALQQALKYINEGYHNVIDLDLKAFFDMVNHDYLMSLLHRKVNDPLLLKLIRRYLQSGIMLNGVKQSRDKGTPQGSPLSPLLSNIILNELDKELTRRGLRFVRYADDCNIFVKSRKAAERVLSSITRFIEGKLRLVVNREKTKICRPVGSVFLGHGFVPEYKAGAKGQYRLRTSDKAFDKFKARVKEITRKTSPKTFDEMIKELTDFTKGWVNYFRQASIWAKLREAEGWIKNRIRYFIWKKWKKPDRRRRAYIQMGIDPQEAYAWSRSRKGGWHIAQSPIMKRTVTTERLESVGYKSVLKMFEKVHYV